VTYLNSACEAITGYSKEELLGKELDDLIAPQHLEGTRRALTQEWAIGKIHSFQNPDYLQERQSGGSEVNSAILEQDGKRPESWRSRGTSPSGCRRRRRCGEARRSSSIFFSNHPQPMGSSTRERCDSWK